jgi:hypothetical protein
VGRAAVASGLVSAAFRSALALPAPPPGQPEHPHLYPIVIIGYMANNLLPLRTGELVRAYVLGRAAA